MATFKQVEQLVQKHDNYSGTYYVRVKTLVNVDQILTIQQNYKPVEVPSLARRESIYAHKVTFMTGGEILISNEPSKVVKP